MPSVLTLSSTPQTYQLDVLPFLVLLTVILLLPEVQQLLLLLLLQLHELLGHLRVQCSQFLLNGGGAVVGAARLRPARTQHTPRGVGHQAPTPCLDLFKFAFLSQIVINTPLISSSAPHTEQEDRLF